MSNIAPWIQLLLEEAGEKNVLLVEGRTDVVVVERWLDLHDPNFRGRLLVRGAGAQPPEPEGGGYSRVIQGVKTHSKLKADEPGKYATTWYGLVDRDERDDTQIDADENTFTTLRALPRNCTESYFVDPEELWNSLPAGQRSHFSGGINDIRKLIEPQIDNWVVPWCMTKVLSQTQFDLTATLGFPKQLVKLLESNPAMPEAKVKEQVKLWQDKFAPDDIYGEFDRLRTTTLAFTLKKKLHSHVHGKHFFRKYVIPNVLSKLVANKTANKWIEDLSAGTTAVPVEVVPILEVVLAA